MWTTALFVAGATELQGQYPLMVYQQWVEARTGWPMAYEAAIDDRGIPAQDFHNAPWYAITCDLPPERASRGATREALATCVASHNEAWADQCREHAVLDRGGVLVVRAVQAWIDGSCAPLEAWPSEAPWVSLVDWPGFGVLEPSRPVPAPGSTFADTVLAWNQAGATQDTPRTFGWAVHPFRYRGQIVYQFGVHQVGHWRALEDTVEGPFNRVDYGPVTPNVLSAELQSVLEEASRPGYVPGQVRQLDPYATSPVE